MVSSQDYMFDSSVCPFLCAFSVTNSPIPIEHGVSCTCCKKYVPVGDRFSLPPTSLISAEFYFGLSTTIFTIRKSWPANPTSFFRGLQKEVSQRLIYVFWKRPSTMCMSTHTLREDNTDKHIEKPLQMIPCGNKFNPMKT